LEKVNGELKKYTHVNKKALDQFSQSSEKEAEIAGKVKEVDVSKTVCFKVALFIEFLVYSQTY
jgi:hypothetical protein